MKISSLHTSAKIPPQKGHFWPFPLTSVQTIYLDILLYLLKCLPLTNRRLHKIVLKKSLLCFENSPKHLKDFRREEQQETLRSEKNFLHSKMLFIIVWDIPNFPTTIYFLNRNIKQRWSEKSDIFHSLFLREEESNWTKTVVIRLRSWPWLCWFIWSQNSWN